MNKFSRAGRDITQDRVNAEMGLFVTKVFSSFKTDFVSFVDLVGSGWDARGQDVIRANGQDTFAEIYCDNSMVKAAKIFTNRDIANGAGLPSWCNLNIPTYYGLPNQALDNVIPDTINDTWDLRLQAQKEYVYNDDVELDWSSTRGPLQGVNYVIANIMDNVNNNLSEYDIIDKTREGLRDYSAMQNSIIGTMRHLITDKDSGELSDIVNSIDGGNKMCLILNLSLSQMYSTIGRGLSDYVIRNMCDIASRDSEYFDKIFRNRTNFEDEILTRFIAAINSEVIMGEVYETIMEETIRRGSGFSQVSEAIDTYYETFGAENLRDSVVEIIKKSLKSVQIDPIGDLGELDINNIINHESPAAVIQYGTAGMLGAFNSMIGYIFAATTGGVDDQWDISTSPRSIVHYKIKKAPVVDMIHWGSLAAYIIGTTGDYSQNEQILNNLIKAFYGVFIMSYGASVVSSNKSATTTLRDRTVATHYFTVGKTTIKDAYDAIIIAIKDDNQRFSDINDDLRSLVFCIQRAVNNNFSETYVKEVIKSKPLSGTGSMEALQGTESVGSIGLGLITDDSKFTGESFADHLTELKAKLGITESGDAMSTESDQSGGCSITMEAIATYQREVDNALRHFVSAEDKADHADSILTIAGAIEAAMNGSREGGDV